MLFRNNVIFALSLVILIAVQITCSDDQVTVLPGLGNITNTHKQYAGYVTVDKERDAGLFYWFFEREGQYDPEENTPVVLWLNGGPGCSAQIGLFVELGPYKVLDDLTLEKNPYSWTKTAHMIFVDQPVGVGYSYSKHPDAYTRNETLVAEHMYILFSEFFTKHPEYKHLDLYLAGESYAGKYLPSIAMRILQANDDPKQVHLNLKGIMIGDGLVDPIIQRQMKTDQSYWNGLMGWTQYLQSNDIKEKCIRQIQKGNTRQIAGACNDIKPIILLTSGAINIYDLRKFEPSTNKTLMELYLNQESVKKALHVDHVNPVYQPCNKNVVYINMNDDILVSVKQLIPHLAKQMKMLIFNGNFDLQDGPIGTEHYLLSLNMTDYNNAPRNLWFVDGDVAGFAQTANENFTFVIVHGAGHFVPTDQPKAALDMLTKFIKNEKFCKPGDSIPIKYATLTPLEIEKYLGEDQRIPCEISQLICEKMFNNCYGNGKCIHGKCFCNDGYSGPTCSHPVTELTEGVMSSEYVIEPQGWHMHKISSHDEAETIVLKVQITGINSTDLPEVGEFNMKFAEPIIGHGLGGVIQPYDRFCIYGRQNDVPNYLEYDFIYCVERHQMNKIVFPIPDSRNYVIGLFNALSGGTDVSFRATFERVKNNSLSVFSFLATIWEFWLIVGVLVLVCLVLLVSLITVSLRHRKKNTDYVKIQNSGPQSQSSTKE